MVSPRYFFQFEVMQGGEAKQRNGASAKTRGASATKWLNRIAQGFSLGNVSKMSRPESGSRGVLWARVSREHIAILDYMTRWDQPHASVATFRAACLRYPGVKPRAMICSRFGQKHMLSCPNFAARMLTSSSSHRKGILWLPIN